MNQRVSEMRCGCRPGHFLCLEAERLWSEVNRTYVLAKTSGDWKSYDRARVAYSRHYAEICREQPR
jgi:hypothetical protein